MPTLTPTTADRVHRIAAEQATRQAQAHLRSFVEQAWSIVEPDTPLRWNWHLTALCNELEAVVNGHTQNLLINIPPGCMKSLLLVFMNPWEWTKKPWMRYLCTANGEDLSTRDNLKVRQIVESEWYQSRWGTQVTLAGDQNQKTRFNTTRHGWRIGVALNGNFIGQHPHRKTVDDPHNTRKALSDKQRKADVAAFDQGLSSRGAGLRASTIVTMQRLHQADLSGHLLANQPQRWVHICFPMRYELPAPNEHGILVPRMAMTPIGTVDPRTERGELLWPDLFPEDIVADQEIALTAYGAAGQLQQRPTPEKGGIFEREWFNKILDAPPNVNDLIAVGRGWDMAATDGGGDWTVGVLLGITTDKRIWILDVVRAQVGPGADDQLLKATTDMDAATWGWRYCVREEQEGGSAGKKVAAAHAILLGGRDYRASTSTGDKPTRAKPFASQAAVGNVVLLRGHWNKQYVDELVLFPNATNDDDVDGTSRIYNELALAPRTQVVTRKLSGF